MVKIRLRRVGAKKRPFYRLVVADSRSPRDGRFIDLLGTYDPISNPAVVTIDEAKVREWLGKGARPSDTARSLLQQQGLIAKTPRPERPAAKKAETPAPEPAAPAAETAAESDAAEVEA